MKRLPRYCLRIDRNGRGARATRVSLTPGQWRARVRLNGGLMRRWILMAGIAGASVAFSASAFAQAAAESVLTHGLSSAAGTSAGTALGRATNQAAGQLGGRLGQQTPTAAPRTGHHHDQAWRPEADEGSSCCDDGATGEWRVGEQWVGEWGINDRIHSGRRTSENTSGLWVGGSSYDHTECGC